MHQVYLSLGTNIRRYFHITAALDALAAEFGDIQCSPVYESEAVGFDGENFLNQVVFIETELSCGVLSSWLKRLEDQNGRNRDQERFSARTLDIDILMVDDLIGTVEGVFLPRPEIVFNAFVLRPLTDLNPNLEHPVVDPGLGQGARRTQRWPYR